MINTNATTTAGMRLSPVEQLLRNSTEIEPVLRQLHNWLNDLRANLDASEWAGLKREFSSHAIRELLHESPFSRRAFEKPRGYAGDAVMLDYIYQGQDVPSTLSAFGRRLFEWEMASGSCQSVFSRRAILAEAVDQTAARCESPRVLSVASGHLREAQYSSAVRQGRIGEYIAFDQDEQSLATVRQDNPNNVIRTVRGSVRDMLKGAAAFPNMDLIYSAGLYDYLNLRTAQRLTSLLFSMLADKGTLLLANFSPNLADIGYMEICMDWNLIYRDESDMLDVAAEIPWDAGRRMYRDEGNNIVYLEITRA